MLSLYIILRFARTRECAGERAGGDVLALAIWQMFSAGKLFELGTKLCNFVQKHRAFLLHAGHTGFVLGRGRNLKLVFDLKDGSGSDGVFVGHEEMVVGTVVEYILL